MTKKKVEAKRIGRPPVTEKAYKVRAVCLDDDTVDFLRTYGENSISEGIRKLVKEAIKRRKK